MNIFLPSNHNTFLRWLQTIKERVDLNAEELNGLESLLETRWAEYQEGLTDLKVREREYNQMQKQIKKYIQQAWKNKSKVN